MVNVNATFRYNANFGPVQAQVRSLAREINMLNASFNSMDSAALKAKTQIAQSFAANINATNQFKASFVDLTSATEQFGQAIDRRTLSLREYFREARRVYQQDSRSARLAERQVRLRRSQVIGLGAGPGGRQRGMVVTPLSLDTSDFNTKMDLAAEKYAIFNRLVDDGATKLINWGKNTQWAGRQLTVGLTVPLTLFGVAVSKTFRDVDAELTRFAKVYGADLVSNNNAATEAMKKQIQSLAVEFSRAYGIAAKETAALSADLAATGLEGDKLLGAVTQTTRLAVLGEVDRQEAMKTTLALQSAFQQSTKELSDTINFLNAVENQTSTTLQDFTAAIPKAGPVVRQLGGDIKDLAVMLTAMREGGIPAAEAANAIKSGLASLINPTKAATERLAKFGVNIQDIVNRNRGELMPTLLEFSGVINQLDQFSRAKVIEELFGKYQFARISALFDNLTRQGNQTAEVFELVGASTADLAKIANKEMTKLTESVSMRFTRAIEGFKASLLPIGETITKSIIPFIEGATTAIGKMVDIFNALPEPVKNAGKFLLGLTAAAGPLIMLAGVFGNFLGYMTKGILSLNNFTRRLMGLPVRKLEILDEQTIAASRATDILTESFNREASSLATLNQQLINYAANLRAAARANPSMFYPGSPARPVRRSTGGDIPGYGGGDKVPALLEPGEFVVRKEVASKNRGFLRSLNSGRVQGFNKGGDVNNFAHSIEPEDLPENQDGSRKRRYYGVGFDIPGSMNRKLSSSFVSKSEYISAISKPDSMETMKALIRRGSPGLSEAQIISMATEYRAELIKRLALAPEKINDRTVYDITKDILNSNGRGSNLVRAGRQVSVDADPSISIKELKKRGVVVGNAKKYKTLAELRKAHPEVIIGDRPRPEPPGPVRGEWAYQYIPAANGQPGYVIQREISKTTGQWGSKYAVYQLDENNYAKRIGRQGGGERSASTYRPTPVVPRPGTPQEQRRPQSGTTSGTGRIPVSIQPGEVTLPPGTYGRNGVFVDRFGRVIRLPGRPGSGPFLPPFLDKGGIGGPNGRVDPIEVYDIKTRQRTTPDPRFGGMIGPDAPDSDMNQRRRGMGSSLMNIGFAGSMLAGMTAMNGEITGATTALTAFTTALMVAGTALEMGSMFRGKGMGAGLMGMKGAGTKLAAKGAGLKAAGAAGGGFGGFLKSGAGMGMMGAGRALIMAGGPYGMAIAAAVAVATAAIIQFNRIMQNMRDSAKAAFVEPTKSAEYFGVELGRTAERAQEFQDIVESLGMSSSKTADMIDQELVQRVGEDYDSLISRLKGSKDAAAVGNDLKLAYSSMIAQGFGASEAQAIVEEIARQAEQRPIYLSIKGELEMLGDDPAKIANNIAENSMRALNLAKQQVATNFQKEAQDAIPGVIKDFTLGLSGSFVPALFNGDQGQFLDFAGAWEATTGFFGRIVDPTKRFSTEMQAALSTVENAGELFGGSMNTMFESFKQFPKEVAPAMDTVLGYVNELEGDQKKAFDASVAKNFTENVADPGLLVFYEKMGTTNEEMSLKMKMAQAASLGLADGLTTLMIQGNLTEGAIDELIQKVILLDSLNTQMDSAIEDGIKAMQKQSKEAAGMYDDKIKAEEKYIKQLDKEAEKAQENHDAYMDSLEDESRALDDRADKIRENAERQQDLIDKKIKSLQLSQEEASFEKQQRERAFGVLGALMAGDSIGYETARLDYVQAQEDRQRELAIQGLQDKKEKIADEADAKLKAIEKEQKAIDDRARAAQKAHEEYLKQNQENQEAAEKRIAKLDREKNKTLKAIQAQINLLEEYKAQGSLTEDQVKEINNKLKKMGVRLPAGVRTAVEKISTEMFGPNGEYTKIVNGLVDEMAKALNVSPEEVRNMLGQSLKGQYSGLGTGTVPAGYRGPITGSSVAPPMPTTAKASGGRIEGPGTPTSDSIIARLSRGEYVVKASSVRKLGTRALDHINSTGRLPGYAEGSPGGVGTNGVGAGQQAGGFWGTGPNAMTILSIRALQDLYNQTKADIQSGATTTTATPGTVPAGEGSQWLANFLSSMGLSGEQLRVAYAIAMRESSGQPNLVSTMDGNGYGLFQIQFGVGHANTINTVLGSNVTDNEVDRQKFAQLMFDPINNFKVMMHMSKSLEDLGAWGLHSWRNPTLNTRDYGGWTASQHQAWIMEPFLRYYSSFPGVDLSSSGTTTGTTFPTGTVQGGSPAPGPAGAARTLSGWPAIPPSVSGSYLTMTNSPSSSKEFYVAKWAVPMFEALMQAWQTHPSLGGGRLSLNSGSSGSYDYRQARASSGMSDHSGGTAVDFRYDILPPFAGHQMTPQERSAVSQLLSGPLGKVFGWGGNYDMAYMDEMHFYLKPTGGVIPAFANGGLVDKSFIPGFEIGTPGGVGYAAAKAARAAGISGPTSTSSYSAPRVIPGRTLPNLTRTFDTSNDNYVAKGKYASKAYVPYALEAKEHFASPKGYSGGKKWRQNMLRMANLGLNNAISFDQWRNLRRSEKEQFIRSISQPNSPATPTLTEFSASPRFIAGGRRMPGSIYQYDSNWWTTFESKAKARVRGLPGGAKKWMIERFQDSAGNFAYRIVPHKMDDRPWWSAWMQSLYDDGTGRDSGLYDYDGIRWPDYGDRGTAGNYALGGLIPGFEVGTPGGVGYAAAKAARAAGLSTTTPRTYTSSTYTGGTPTAAYSPSYSTYTPNWSAKKWNLPYQSKTPYGVGRIPGTRSPFGSSYGMTADQMAIRSQNQSHKLGAYATSSEVAAYLADKSGRGTFVPGYGYVGSSAKSSSGGKKYQSYLSLLSSPYGTAARTQLPAAARGKPTLEYWRTLSREQKKWYMDLLSGRSRSWTNKKPFRLMPWIPQAPETVTKPYFSMAANDRIKMHYSYAPISRPGMYSGNTPGAGYSAPGTWVTSNRGQGNRVPIGQHNRAPISSWVPYLDEPPMTSPNITGGPGVSDPRNTYDPYGGWIPLPGDTLQPGYPDWGARGTYGQADWWKGISSWWNNMTNSIYASRGPSGDLIKFKPNMTPLTTRTTPQEQYPIGMAGLHMGQDGPFSVGPRGAVGYSGRRRSITETLAIEALRRISERSTGVGKLTLNRELARYPVLEELVGTSDFEFLERRKAGGASKDDILARVSRGEYIVNSKAVSSIGIKNMDMINQGALPGFNVGGLVKDPKFRVPSNKSVGRITDSDNMMKDGDYIEYNINVSVAETNASPTEIANKVMKTLKTNQNTRRLRSNG